MSLGQPLFGQLRPDEVLDQWRSLSASTRDSLIVFAAFTFVVASILLWAIYVRKPRRRHHSRRRSHHSSSANRGADEAASQSPKRRKWRRPRRDHRPRNPTLAETGGLPPVRDQSPPESSF